MRHLKLFRLLLRYFQDCVRIESFTKVALEKLQRNFKLIPIKFQKTYKGISQLFLKKYSKILEKFLRILDEGKR